MGVVKDAGKQVVHRALKSAFGEGLLASAYGRFGAMPRVHRQLVKATPPPLAYSFGETRSCIRGGCEFRLEPRHYSQWHSYFGLRDPVLDVLVRLASVSRLVLDVGANVGLYSIAMAKAVPPGGQVVAFEPNPEAATRLAEHIAANGVTEIVRQRTEALGRISSSAILRRAGDGDLGKCTLRGDGSVLEDVGVVTVRSLDELFSAEDGIAPDLIKIDVEGHEPEVLAGAAGVLRRATPTLVMELSPQWSGASLAAMYDEVVAIGYAPYTLQFSGPQACSWAELRRLDSQANVLFVHERQVAHVRRVNLGILKADRTA